MEDTYIIITINGVDYYIEASRLNDLKYIDNKLVNVSNSNITLVNNFDTTTTYPRITCSSMSQCQLRTSQLSSYTAVTSNYSIKNNKFNMNTLGNLNQNNIIIALLLIIIGLKLIWKK